MKTQELKDRTYKLTRNSAPLSFIIPTRNTRRSPLLWFDPDKKVNRALRYSVNQKSPFEDEQDNNAIVEPVIFENGFLRVPATNPILQQFLTLHPLYGKAFVEVDAEVDAEKEVDKMLIEADAVSIIRNMSPDELEKLGRVLLGKNTSMISTSEIRRDMLIFAKKYPSKVISTAKDPNTKIQSVIRELFDMHLLTFRNNKKEVFFNMASNKKRMLTVPIDTDPYVSVEQYFLTESGLQELEALKDELKMLK